MKSICFSIFLMFSISSLFSQTDSSTIVIKDTIYYKMGGGYVVNTNREKAEGFGFKSEFNPNIYQKKVLYLQSETPMVIYECYDKEFANAKTNVVSKMTLKNGLYEEWYISGEKRVSCYYKEDKLDGIFKVFHKNGKVKRSELWKAGEWQSGDCFDEDGKKKPYCSYQEQAQFVGGLPQMFEFLANELKYPNSARKNGVEGTVYVGFIVEKDGSLSELSIKRGVEKSLNEEALRIVKAMPKWKPGKFEGELVRYDFVLPIRFKLE